MRRVIIRIMASIVWFFFGAAAWGSRPSIILLREAQIQGSTVYLSDFLPVNVSVGMCAATQKIALGAAPDGGTLRQFTREKIAAVIAESGLSSTLFLIPESMTARRAGRLLSRDEIFAAIREAIAKNQMADLVGIRPEDLTWNTSMEVPPGEVRLQVTQIRFDEALAQARFRIWPHSAAGMVPFYVTARLPSAKNAGVLSQSIKRAKFDVTKEYPSSTVAVVLVDPREYARLHLHSSNSDALLEVRPLQRGHLGETIRVRLPGSGKTLQAQVIGNNSLDAFF